MSVQSGEAAFWSAVEEASRFFMGEADVQHALKKLIELLEREQIPYAIAGAMALNEYGYRRVTTDVDVLLSATGLAKFKAAAVGRGYVEKFPGSRGLKDTENSVSVDVLVAGEYPGDGKPKPVAFPDPASVARRSQHGAFLPLTTLIELKLASGMSAPHRLKDLADVLELVRAARLTESLADGMNPWVREKYLELWRAAQSAPSE